MEYSYKIVHNKCDNKCECRSLINIGWGGHGAVVEEKMDDNFIRQRQGDDEVISEVIKNVKTNKGRWNSYVLKDGILFSKKTPSNPINLK